ncbi:MAG: sigma-E factor negative regulatory protein [Thioalkalivibrio sp.]|nr:sigma-E factor negative regulatory protein [Thioalkalivibrio sp.]
MNDQVSKSERLSALVDNETEGFETRRLIDELLKSEDDRRIWSRYHLVGDSLRGGMKRIAPRDFLAGVQSGIADDEPLHVRGDPPSSGRWMKPVAGVGIAAAVAMVSLLGLQTITGTDDRVPTATAETGTIQEPPESELVTAPDPRFARYFENHAELVAPGSSAFARVRNSVDGE